MKSQEEIEMEWAYAEVRRLEAMLQKAKDVADVAWRAYVHRPKTDLTNPVKKDES